MSSVDQVFVGRDEKRAPLKTKTPAWEASLHPVFPYNIAVSSVFVCVCVCVCVCVWGGGYKAYLRLKRNLHSLRSIPLQGLLCLLPNPITKSNI